MVLEKGSIHVQNSAITHDTISYSYIPLRVGYHCYYMSPLDIIVITCVRRISLLLHVSVGYHCDYMCP